MYFSLFQKQLLYNIIAFKLRRFGMQNIQWLILHSHGAFRFLHQLCLKFSALNFKKFHYKTASKIKYKIYTLFTQLNYKFPLQTPITAYSIRSDNSNTTIIITTFTIKSKHWKLKCLKSKYLKLKHLEVYWL